MDTKSKGDVSEADAEESEHAAHPEVEPLTQSEPDARSDRLLREPPPARTPRILHWISWTLGVLVVFCLALAIWVWVDIIESFW